MKKVYDTCGINTLHIQTHNDSRTQSRTDKLLGNFPPNKGGS